jgi:TrpR-related protein YerC/YecD
MTSGKVRTDGEGSPERFDELVSSLTAIRDDDTMRRFLRDLCTVAELDAMGQRLQVAALVEQAIPYAEISRLTGASTATVTRVAHWLRYGEGGYREVLKKVKR